VPTPKSITIHRAVTVGAVAVQAATATPRRRSLEFWVSSSGRITISHSSGTAIDADITMTSSNSKVVLDRDIHGEIVTYDFWAIGSAAGQILNIVEVLYAS